MGTSNSYGGPGGRPPLLPPWAFPSPDPGGGPPPPPDDNAPPPPGDAATSRTPDSSPADPASLTSANPSPVPAPLPKKVQVSISRWSSAKRSMGKVASSRGEPSRLRSAVRRYVRAMGGGQRAARSSRAGRRATALLGGFLSDVARRSLAGAMESLGLSRYIGQSPEVVMAAIANALAPEGATREEAIARRATNDALKEFYERYVVPVGDLNKMTAVPAQAVVDAMTTAVSSYIYRRWLSDLGLKIEQNAVSRQQAIRLEKEVKRFVRNAVRFDLKGKDALNMNWKSPETRAFIERIYRDAYDLLGGGE